MSDDDHVIVAHLTVCGAATPATERLALAALAAATVTMAARLRPLGVEVAATVEDGDGQAG